MKRLLNQIESVNQETREIIETRVKEFKKMHGSNLWFSELCFCILTANSKAATGWAIQKELGLKGFKNLSEKEIISCIRRNKHRFHNTKGSRIVEARKHGNVKKVITTLVKKEGVVAARDWLVKNVKGYGYKEASHFLRNVGYFEVSILDRHILNLMYEHKMIKEVPKSLNRKSYLEMEEQFRRLASKSGMSMGELDLYMWYLKTGKVMK